MQASFFAEPGGTEALGYVARTQRTRTGGNAYTTTCSMLGLFESKCAGEYLLVEYSGPSAGRRSGSAGFFKMREFWTRY